MMHLIKAFNRLNVTNLPRNFIIEEQFSSWLIWIAFFVFYQQFYCLCIKIVIRITLYVISKLFFSPNFFKSGKLPLKFVQQLFNPKKFLGKIGYHSCHSGVYSSFCNNVCNSVYDNACPSMTCAAIQIIFNCYTYHLSRQLCLSNLLLVLLIVFLML